MRPYFDPRRHGRWRDCWADMARSILCGTADMTPLRRALCHYRTDRLLDRTALITTAATILFLGGQLIRMSLP